MSYRASKLFFIALWLLINSFFNLFNIWLFSVKLFLRFYRSEGSIFSSNNVLILVRGNSWVLVVGERWNWGIVVDLLDLVCLGWGVRFWFSDSDISDMTFRVSSLYGIFSSEKLCMGFSFKTSSSDLIFFTFMDGDFIGLITHFTFRLGASLFTCN